ncbi:MAG: hypothetical protein L6W00_17155 [Lentisphaeria bacterium]|nr:MAG: hypothetical protein L6W00_17155 [Lentisphaeria bacterium]
MNCSVRFRLLRKIYLRSVGCGGFLNLGIAPDRRGVLHENDVRRLREFREMVEALNGEDVVSTALSLSAGEEAVVEFGAKRAFNLIDMAEDLSAGGVRHRIHDRGADRRRLAGDCFREGGRTAPDEAAAGDRRRCAAVPVDLRRYRCRAADARLSAGPGGIAEPRAEGAGLPDRENYLELPPGRNGGWRWSGSSRSRSFRMDFSIRRFPADGPARRTNTGLNC